METIQKIAYLLNKFGPEGTNVIKLAKLMVIADVYKLRKYGSELLQQEEYFALENGPVPSNTENLINHSSEYLSEQELEMSKKMWERISERNNIWDIVQIKGEVDKEYLSEIDQKLLITLLKITVNTHQKTSSKKCINIMLGKNMKQI